MTHVHVLPDHSIRALIEGEAIHAPAPVLGQQIQPASLDLRIGPVGLEVSASMFPDPHHGIDAHLQALQAREFEVGGGAILRVGHRYLFELMEGMNLPPTVAALANPKSTTGRLDIVVRLIPEYGDSTDVVSAGFRGRLFLEVAPRTFNIIVHPGTRLTQLRFLTCSCQAAEPPSRGCRNSEHMLGSNRLHGEEDRPDTLLTLDLRGEDTAGTIGFRSTHNPVPIDIDAKASYDVSAYWEPIVSPREDFFLFEPDRLHVLRSREKVCIHARESAVMLPFTEAVGEFLFHYAGFFDPGFGYADGEPAGSPAGLVVRSRWTPLLLRDGQTLARLRYQRLKLPPERLYGAGIGSSYNGRKLPLSKHFRTD